MVSTRDTKLPMAILLAITFVNVGIVLSFLLSALPLGLTGKLLAVVILEFALVLIAVFYARQASPDAIRAFDRHFR